MLASLFFLPVAGKLKSRTAVEIVNLEIIFEGALSILDNNNPLLIYEKLSSFIPPTIRDKYEANKVTRG
jgi:chemotaxis protein MotA